MRFAWRLTVLLASATLLACAGLELDRRTLRVGTSGDYAPFSLDGQGFDVQVARDLGRHLGLRIEWVPFRWPELARDVAAGRFDVAMSGITWRPDRAVRGELTRAVAQGGPCLIGEPVPARLGVNRGGFLAGFARENFRSARIIEVDGNAGLPELLAARDVDAILTDSFELPYFVRPGQTSRCFPPRHRKVYWVTPAAPPDLAARIDVWLSEAEPQLRALRAHFFGDAGPRDELDHLIDLLARRLALMPEVARAKRGRALPIEDRAREGVVLDGVSAHARALGLAPGPVRALFAQHIELAKRVQQRAEGRPGGPALDLETQLRPLLTRLGTQIVASLAKLAPLAPRPLPPGRLAPLAEHARVQRRSMR